MNMSATCFTVAQIGRSSDFTSNTRCRSAVIADSEGEGSDGTSTGAVTRVSCAGSGVVSGGDTACRLSIRSAADANTAPGPSDSISRTSRENAASRMRSGGLIRGTASTLVACGFMRHSLCGVNRWANSGLSFAHRHAMVRDRLIARAACVMVLPDSRWRRNSSCSDVIFTFVSLGYEAACPPH